MLVILIMNWVIVNWLVCTVVNWLVVENGSVQLMYCDCLCGLSCCCLCESVIECESVIHNFPVLLD